MPLYHLSMKPLSRSNGRSAVAAAAYRAGEKLVNERDGLTHDFTRKQGIDHVEIILPTGSKAAWARDRSALWHAAEVAEKRKDARVAREVEIALPHEMTDAQRLELTREFAQGLADRYGAAVDFALHAPHGKTDIRNHHAHLLMTTRTVDVDGLGDKTNIERENKWLLKRDLPTSHRQLRDIRQSWEQHANDHLARAGHDLRIDHRSHQERGLELEPTQHVGVHATQMERRGLDVSRVRQDEASAKRNAELIRKKPEQVLTLLTDEKSVFDRRDVARTLHRYIDDPKAFQSAFAKVMASPALVELQGEQMDTAQGATLARYSTREMVEIETGMAARASRMHAAQGYAVAPKHVDRALTRHDEAIRSRVAASLADKVERGEMDAAEQRQHIKAARLSDEQRAAIEHVTGQERLSVVVGYAGAGKSTLLAAAKEAWEAQGYRVHGAALAGKAAEGLEDSSGIQSRTLASWDYGWQKGRGTLGRGDVLVIDEAGMVGSKQLARFVAEAEASGAKLVLVGDHEQLQSIGAGAAFRAVSEQVGCVSLEEVRRQRANWQRAASVDFASHQTDKGLQAYAERGAVHLEETRGDARAAIVRDYLADRDARPEGSRVALAHRRVDVRAINAAIRAARQERGELAQGEKAGEIPYQTHDGERSFAPGDRIVFLENNRDLDVKNGMLGTVEAVEADKITARLDGSDRGVSVPVSDYGAVDHGYATTIHKSQGATVDRAFVMASHTMDRHLSYVAMTRHRDSVQLYAGKEDFKDFRALSSRLSRSGAKETTLDYMGYAARRGLSKEFVVKRESEFDRSARRTSGEALARKAPRETIAAERPEEAGKPRRGMFDGLRLNAASKRSQGPEGSRKPPSSEPLHPSDFERSVDRYARAFRAADRMARDTLPVLESQRQALGRASQQLEKAQPGASGLMHSALQHDPGTRQAMTALTGRARAAHLMQGMVRERQLQADPTVRADRLVDRWQELDGQRQKLGGRQDDETRGRVEGAMRQVAETIKRDPQVESLMRNRTRELGLQRLRADQSLGQAMERQLSRGRGRSVGFER